MRLHVYRAMADRDANEEAPRNVEKATEFDPVRGEDLPESPELKRKLEDARKALRPELPAGDPSGEESVEQP